MKNSSRYQSYAFPLLRIGMAALFLWFGISQLLNPLFLIAYLPAWLESLLPVPAAIFLFLNGLFETVFGLLLLLGLFTRIAALLLSIHVFVIAAGIGYNDIGIRDAAIAVATLAIFLHGPDQWCVDRKLKHRVMRKLQ